MEKHASSAVLKAHAKGQLLGKYGTVVPAVILVELIISLLTSLITFQVDLMTLKGFYLELAIECVIQVFAGLFVMGQTYLYLNVACGGNVKTSDVFYAFKSNPNKAIMIQLLELALSLAAMVPFLLFFSLWYVSDSALMLLLMSVGLCISLVAVVLVSLTYSQAFFVALDFPQLKPVECLRQSRRIMKGSKARLFYINVSFLPLQLLGLLSCGIGTLFLSPYINTTATNFYLELMSYRARHGIQ